MVLAPLSKIKWPMCEFIYVHSVLFHWSICLFICQHYTFNYCSFVVSVEIRKCESFNLFFFKIILAVWGPLKFPMNLRISFPSIQKMAIGILIRIISDLQIALSSTDMLILSLQVLEHWMFSCLLGSFKISFNSVLQFSEYKFHTSVKFIVRYFIF